MKLTGLVVCCILVATMIGCNNPGMRAHQPPNLFARIKSSTEKKQSPATSKIALAQLKERQQVLGGVRHSSLVAAENDSPRSPVKQVSYASEPDDKSSYIQTAFSRQGDDQADNKKDDKWSRYLDAESGESEQPNSDKGSSDKREPAFTDDSQGELLSIPDVGLKQDYRENGLTLAVVEQWAINCNPAIQRTEASKRALYGKFVQEGLQPNPFFGVNGEDIFDEGGSGRFGVFFGRKEIQGNKLQLSQNVVAAEIEVANRRLAEMVQRVLTDVRSCFYRMLIAQEKLDVATRLAEINRRILEKSQSLFDAGEISKTIVLQADLEFESSRLAEERVGNEMLAASRQLAAMICESNLPAERVIGSIENIEAKEFELSFDELLADSPEIAALMADVCRAQRKLEREFVEPIPDVSWQATVQYDTVSDSIVSGFQVQMPIPKFDQNQGNISKARQEVVAAEREAEVKTIQLRQKLISAYESYRDAYIQVRTLDEKILPKAREALDLTSQGYEAGEIDFMQLLTAQRSYTQNYSSYIRSQQQLWDEKINIEGMLLSGSLE